MLGVRQHLGCWAGGIGLERRRHAAHPQACAVRSYMAGAWQAGVLLRSVASSSNAVTRQHASGVTNKLAAHDIAFAGY